MWEARVKSRWACDGHLRELYVHPRCEDQAAYLEAPVSGRTIFLLMVDGKPGRREVLRDLHNLHKEKWISILVLRNYRA